MTRDEMTAIVREELTNVAPDLADETIPIDADLREEFDLDSMDFLNWITALHKRLGVDIPELDYPQLTSLGAAADYLLRATDRTKSS
ncbi:MAG: acyl carrier protein [Thiohalocapsa sp.]|jgi:acyl carrier protein|uniref:acyl carrier protein n=1 Tax=Thiohalocapsa sp. TaxID=2497641 RepID=UPI0025DF0593|nr:acyl carrier protein [Thiohalocapsa sp.]MCG6942845.1 acyl carrier protein [Thiohalocapsa sp.]